MKTVLPLTIAALCFSFHSQGQTNSLMWRGNNIPVVFYGDNSNALAVVFAESNEIAAAALDETAEIMSGLTAC